MSQLKLYFPYVIGTISYSVTSFLTMLPNISQCCYFISRNNDLISHNVTIPHFCNFISRILTLYLKM